MKLTAFVLLTALPAWLALDRGRRNEIATAALGHALGKGGVSLRFFDAEAFSTRASDIAVFEADEPKDYYFAMERLRDTELLSVPYFRIEDVIPAYEQGFRAFEAEG